MFLLGFICFFCSLSSPGCKFRCHVARFVAMGMLFQEVGKEEYLEYGEYDEQFDKDDDPQGTPQRHIPEAIAVEVVDPVCKTVFSHIG